MQHDFFFLIINSFYELFYFKLAFTSFSEIVVVEVLLGCRKRKIKAAATEVPKKSMN